MAKKTKKQNIVVLFNSYENYNYKWTWHDTPGFWSEHGRINVGENGLESGVRVRCVRDKE